ncbi:hypothetical protein ACH44C_31760 [Streptomyces purpureus]|uniref:hypothetical protein n=1 Tax=Streptomyces purpureus TaxID=1951 RepID=UPI0037B7558C
MRPRNALAVGVAAATVGTAMMMSTAPPAAATPTVAKPPICGKAADPRFPIDTRIHRGPADYTPGTTFHTWGVGLTNTTGGPCRAIHPVLALTDRDRTLKPAQIRFEFYDAGARRWRPVTFETTEEDENVGVFDDGFPGFALPAGGTLTVPVRLAFASGTAPNEVTANAAIVQRRGDDGDWVGESDEYRLTIAPAKAPDPETTPPVPLPPQLARTGAPEDGAVGPATGTAALLAGAGTTLVAATRRRLR